MVSKKSDQAAKRRWPHFRFWISLALAGSLWMFAGDGARAASIQPLEIVTKTGVHVFAVEMATTEEEKTTGLMYRKELAEGQGMLFDFSPEQEVSMSTKIIPSRGMAKAVLEVIGGTAQKYGIAPGDRVGHPLFNSK